MVTYSSGSANIWLMVSYSTLIMVRTAVNVRFRKNVPDELMGQIDSFKKHIQKRLRKIEKNWAHFTAFYFVKGAPATNNGVENYYSTSLKTHRKKQLRTDKGIENQMKLSAMKRAGLLGKCKKTLLEVFLMFWYSFG